MNKEIWDIFNEKGALTGKTAVRGRGFLKPGEYHLVVHIWVVSGDGRYLIQRRSESKKLMPGEWAATGGAAISGESSFTAAKRELFEELSVLRKELADRQGIPPYIVLTDKTLHLIAAQRPTSIEAFGMVSGIGDYKKEK